MRAVPLALLVTAGISLCARAADPPREVPARLRIVIETDAGGDPDDEQSLVRFLLYANEWDIEGIISNRPEARDGENVNVERTGLDIVRQMLDAYGRCHANLMLHDPRYPTVEYLRARTVSGYADNDDGVRLILDAVDSNDPRPLWFCNWGTDHGSAPSSLLRALDRVLRERGEQGYARFKNRLRLSSDDQFGAHTWEIAPAFPLWIDTLRPELDGKRWYHRFSAITATAGGFDIERDVRTGHGPLGALYPTNTTPPQKEGDSMMFLYLVPTGMNDPEQPTLGSWAGRYGLRDEADGRAYFWANQQDTWNGTTHRENSLHRWAEHLQNDFRARMDWCVLPRDRANHPPVVNITGDLQRTAKSGDAVTLDAGASTDPDGDALRYSWVYYAAPGTYRDNVRLSRTESPTAQVYAPVVESLCDIQIVVAVTDNGNPPLTRYARSRITVRPN